MARWLLFAALAGCGHAAPPASSHEVARAPRDAAPPDAAALDDDLPRLAARSTQLYQDLATALAGVTDCAIATDKIGALETSYADVIAANARVAHSEKAATYRQALESHMTEIAAAMATIGDAPVVVTCADDDRFTAAMDRLGGAS